MKVYFLSSRPCALFVAGTYFGITGDFQQFAEVALKDRLPVQFVPEGAQPLTCFLTETLPVSPPDGTEVYLLPDGIALRACHFPPNDFTLMPIAQKRFLNGLVTVYRQGDVQVAMETDYGFFNASLPPSFLECSIEIEGEFILLFGINSLAVFHQNGKKIIEEHCLSYEIERIDERVLLHAVLPLSDRFQRTANCSYLLSETGATRTAYTLQQSADAPKEEISTLFVYAFFESVRIGADITSFLGETLLPKAALLADFLGKFLYVLPTNDPHVCHLVYKKNERLYDVRPFTATLHNGKITDVQG